ncbi:extracellular solute-binding protein [Haloplasma contractile]|uniref:ABC transporter substrate-binding protein n=1 Tax=Haloplasma contractile SSD-17B TaxID=1033810 RepID=U2EG49_9MOLU|nr:extracellular solute-binding protein [Haloplasma contractile]ERJ13591.1 ABC transporter substrate-binding protein [Haloplasma contractile SSD-17B]
MKKFAILFAVLVMTFALVGCAKKRNQAPEIQGAVTTQTIEIGSEYDPLDGVVVTDDNDGTITSDIEVIGSYDVDSVGEYTFSLKVKDSEGLTDEVTIKLIVEDPNSDNQRPTLVGVSANQTYYIGSGAYNPIANVSAVDAEDGAITDITVEYPDNYDLTTAGTYVLIIKVVDSQNALAQQTVQLTVKEPTVPNALTSDDIEITFWHAFGQEKEGFVREYADEFEALYPNVTITLQSQGGYTELLDKVTSSIVADNIPTMLIGYPDHVVNYLSADAVEPLDQYASHPEHGIELNDFVQSYIDENTSFNSEGTLYGLPFNKSTEVLIYNKDFFDNNSLTVPTSWVEVAAISEEVRNDYTADDVYGFAYDSAANMFITLTRQWGGEYTGIDANANGEYLFDNAQTRSMLTYFKGLEQQNYVTLPQAWEQDYASDPFKNEKVFMTVGSTAGITYNIPAEGTFEIGVAPIPQYDENNKHVIQQGTNISILKSDSISDQEKLAAWLFAKYLTSPDVTTDWAIKTGYLPVRESAYTSDEYAQFLDYSDATGNEKYISMAANAAYEQKDFMFVDQPFSGSSKARAQVDSLTTQVIVGDVSIDQAIANALAELE